MRKQMKKTLSAVLAVVMMLSIIGIINAGAVSNTVKVIVRNTNFKTSDGALWEGVLINADIELKTTDSVETVLERAITENGYEFTVSPYGYISSVNNLAEYANNGSGGWMATLNDWFTADSVSAYTVENGDLQAGDEIVMMYTNDWGADCGSLYGDLNTKLSNSQIIEGDFVSEETKSSFKYGFDPDTNQGTITIRAAHADIALYPEAQNKNYQVRTYLNEYQPTVNGTEIRRGRRFAVKGGDKVYIGVGNAAWPTMNSWVGTADETVYTFTVKYVPVKGDLDGNGVLGINDVTEVQRYIAEFRTLDNSQIAIVDYDNDGAVTVNDATKMQRLIAEYDD